MDRETTPEPTAAHQRHRSGTSPETGASPSQPAFAGTPAGGIASGSDLVMMARGDLGSRAQVLERIQRDAGNGAAGMVAASARAGRVYRSPVESPAAGATVQRSPDEETVYDVTEEIGPVSESPYTVEADSLAAFHDAISVRDEAGSVSWEPNNWSHSGAPSGDPPTVSVSVTVPITLQMPEWELPEDMGPRTRAEYRRWYAALRAHEQGHIDLVRERTQGLADRMARLSLARARSLFTTTIAGLQTASDEYDARTQHGLATGTVLDLSIEEEERGEGEEGEE